MRKEIQKDEKVNNEGRERKKVRKEETKGCE